MKKLVLIILIAISSTSAFSQSETSVFPLNPDTGEIYYSEAINVEGKSKDDLFVYASSWFADTFVSAQDVVQFSDKDKGVIIGKGNFDVKKGVVKFTTKISVKEGRYKYELYDFIYKINPGGIQTHGDLKQEKPGGGISSMGEGAWNKEKERAIIKINEFISSLNNGMSSSKVLTNDNW